MTKVGPKAPAAVPTRETFGALPIAAISPARNAHKEIRQYVDVS